MRPVTEPTIWLRHERALRAAQFMIPLLVRVGDVEHAQMWMDWLFGLFEVKALDHS